MRRENVSRALSTLPQREREVIELRYGISGGRPLTLEEVGHGHDQPRCAEPALHGAGLDEGILHRAQSIHTTPTLTLPLRGRGI